MYIYVYMCLYIYIYICIYICTYIYIYVLMIIRRTHCFHSFISICNIYYIYTSNKMSNLILSTFFVTKHFYCLQIKGNAIGTVCTP